MRHCVLTIGVGEQGMKNRADHITASFRRLRETTLWAECVRAFVATMEITEGTNRQWHVHLHVLWDGKFIPHAKLKAAWQRATGDSMIVYLKHVPDRDKAAGYVASYVAKPPEAMIMTEEEVREFADAFAGRRMLITGGPKPAVVNEEDDVPDVKEPATLLVDVNRMHAQESLGIEQVSHACDILSRLSVPLALALDRPPPCETLPPVTGEEYSFALAVASYVQSLGFGPADSEQLDALRRKLFGIPTPPPPTRWVQLTLQRGGPGTV